MRRATPHLALLLLAAVLPTDAVATTARGLDLAEHAALSDVVVEGRVVARTRARADGQDFLDYTVDVDRAWRGTAPARLLVRKLGPERVVVGDGQVEVGDRVVLFLRRGPHARFYLTALAQSVYQVLGSGDHAPVVRALDGLSLVRQDAAGRLAPAPPPPDPPTLHALRRALEALR